MTSLLIWARKVMFNKPSNYLISPSSYVDIESTDTFFLIQRMNTNFQELNQNKYQKYLFIQYSKNIKVDNLRNTMEKFKGELKDLKNILNAIKELEIFREQEINEIKNETKRELNMLYHEISDILEKLDVNLTTLKLRCRLRKKKKILKKKEN